MKITTAEPFPNTFSILKHKYLIVSNCSKIWILAFGLSAQSRCKRRIKDSAISYWEIRVQPRDKNKLRVSQQSNRRSHLFAAKSVTGIQTKKVRTVRLALKTPLDPTIWILLLPKTSQFVYLFLQFIVNDPRIRNTTVNCAQSNGNANI